MPTARFKSEPHRQEFVANLSARGYKQVGPRETFSRLPYMTFRVYDYMPRHCVTPELRVSYYESQTGPCKAIPTPSDRQKPGTATGCTTPGHSKRKAFCRNLCTNCYQRWYYWTKAEFRKRKRIKSLRRKKQRALLPSCNAAQIHARIHEIEAEGE